jgi:hypothetical protein
MTQRFVMWWRRNRRFQQCNHAIGDHSYSAYCSRDRRHKKWDPLHLAVWTQQAWLDDGQVDYPESHEAARRILADRGEIARFEVQ